MNYNLKEGSKRLFGFKKENVEGKEVTIPFGYIQKTNEENIYLVFCGFNGKDGFNKALHSKIEPFIIATEHTEEENWDGSMKKKYFYNIKVDNLDFVKDIVTTNL